MSTPESTTSPPSLDERIQPPSRERQALREPTIEHRQLSARERLRRLLAPRVRLYQLAVLSILLGVWEYAGRTSPSFTFAPPSSVFPAARELIGSGELGGALTDSLLALAIGVALAAVVGNAIGLAMGWWRTVGGTLDPFVAAGYVVPVVALVPLIIVWAGLGMLSRIVVIFLFAVFEIIFTAQSGVRNIDPAVLDVARVFGAGRRDMLRKVVLPASLPFVFLGLRIGVIRGLKGMVLAEMLFAITGLGGIVIKYAQLFRMDKVLVAIVTLALIGMLLAGALRVLERRVLRWQW